MDPITTAIVAALGKLAEPVVKDAYQGLKTLILKKFGSKGDLADAIDKLEQRSESDARIAVVHEELASVKADQDQELLRAAQSLIQKIEAQPGGSQFIQMVIGKHNIVGGRDVIIGSDPRKK
jgi:hypothetical protein